MRIGQSGIPPRGLGFPGLQFPHAWLPLPLKGLPEGLAKTRGEGSMACDNQRAAHQTRARVTPMTDTPHHRRLLTPGRVKLILDDMP
jgi:hypothetical protein